MDESFYASLISIFQLLTFHLYVATFQRHLHMEYTSLMQLIRYSSWWFLSGFSGERFAANKEATEPRIPILSLVLSATPHERGSNSQL
jgi:hypothetical protein